MNDQRYHITEHRYNGFALTIELKIVSEKIDDIIMLIMKIQFDKRSVKKGKR